MQTLPARHLAGRVRRAAGTPRSHTRLPLASTAHIRVAVKEATTVSLYHSDDPDTIPYALALENDARWSAMLDRDTVGTGPFVIAVATSGIYCRVGCPTRRCAGMPASSPPSTMPVAVGSKRANAATRTTTPADVAEASLRT
jgi:hypothetical protein